MTPELRASCRIALYRAPKPGTRKAAFQIMSQIHRLTNLCLGMKLNTYFASGSTILGVIVWTSRTPSTFDTGGVMVPIHGYTPGAAPSGTTSLPTSRGSLGVG